MGVTIRYQGRLSPKAKAKELYILAKIHCEKLKWGMTPFETQGDAIFFALHPHDHCELVSFKVGTDGRFRDSCKTQFAPVEVHMGVVGLFDALRSRLAELVIEDEGDYWETRDRARLQGRIDDCYQAIGKTMQEDPAYYGPVRGEDGRITDLLRRT